MKVLIKSWADFIRNAVFLWASLVSVVSGSTYYLAVYEGFIKTHLLEIGIIVLFLVALVLLVYTFHSILKKVVAELRKDIESMKIASLKYEVRQFFDKYEHAECIPEKDAEHLFMLEEKRQHYGVNSFTQRKLRHLLEKNIG